MVSTCIHCGHEHDPHMRICPRTGKPVSPIIAPLAKTMLGVGPVSALPAPTSDPGLNTVTAPIAKNEGSESSKTVLGIPTPIPHSVTGPNVTYPTDAVLAEDKRVLTPVDLPRLGMQKPLPLPAVTEAVVRPDSFPERMRNSAKSVLELLKWSVGIYFRFPVRLFFLAAMVVLPASFANSFIRVGVSAMSAPVLDPKFALVDFSARRAELVDRIAKGQAAGQVDQQAMAELAALASVITQTDTSPPLPLSGTGWFVQILIAFITGVLLSGLAYPIAVGALAIAAGARQSGYAIPTVGETLGILSRRAMKLLSALLPAAILTAIGYVFFVIPGLVLSILFVLISTVVLFEKQGSFAAIKRSIELVRMDVSRIAMLLVAFAMTVFILSLFIALFSGPTDSRALTFVRSILSDALVVAVLPIPSLAIARIYFDLRKRAGNSISDVVHGARD